MMETILLPYPVALAVYALVAIGGLFDCFFGFKLFRTTLSMLLGLTAAVGLGLVAWEWSGGHWITTGVSACVGLLLGALLAFQMLRALIALLVGGIVGLLAASALQNEPYWMQTFGPWIAGLVAGGLAALLVQPSLLLLTAFTGAFRFVFGLWFIVGGPDAFGLMQPGVPLWNDLGRFGLALAASLLLGLLGWWFQQLQNRPKED
ncbi:MAG: hypothetical protein Q7P63_05035 [Verrucomicrobiota bacterium JB022]|nr:hypothetical protein [Verrucomicrobiota bacterium JB022]